jgi:glucose 1-dehydrogenase
MKAIAVFPAERRFDAIDHPEPYITSPNQVKIRMLDVGICGTDKEIVNFEYGTPPDGSPYLVLGHESLGEVIETGAGVSHLKPGDLAVATVRRPCHVPSCLACRSGRQDFCYTGQYTERGIVRQHGYMTEAVVEDAQFVNPVPRNLRDVAVLVEPLTVAEKAITQLWEVQRRLPWTPAAKPGEPRAHGRNALVLGAGPVGLLGAMKLMLEGFNTTVYSRMPPAADVAGLVTSIGAKFVHAETTDVPTLAEQVGTIDVVYEAAGVSSLAYEVMQYLGVNGAFIFTGVPGRKPASPVDTDRLMRGHVLKNQIIFGTVNASIDDFKSAIADVGSFSQRWPDALPRIISQRVPIEHAKDPLMGKACGIKTVIAIHPS